MFSTHLPTGWLDLAKSMPRVGADYAWPIFRIVAMIYFIVILSRDFDAIADPAVRNAFSHLFIVVLLGLARKGKS